MSFVRNIFGKMSDNKEEVEDEEDVSEETSVSSDAGFFSPGNSNSDLDTRLQGAAVEADCSTISNFFGYWYVGFVWLSVQKNMCLMSLFSLLYYITIIYSIHSILYYT